MGLDIRPPPERWPPSASEDDEPVADEPRPRVVSALAVLTVRERDVMLLYVGRGLSLRTCARLLRTPKTTVWRLYHTGLTKLRRLSRDR